MTGRGLDQILRHPSLPVLYESWITDARDYVRLAERKSGPIPRGVPDAYVWGDLLADLDTLQPDLRIINLETAITRADRAEPKGINYRMHPANAGVLTAARIDACILANNHVMDWGRKGLSETLAVLDTQGIACVGAGPVQTICEAPVALPYPGGGRVLIVAVASSDSGVPAHWQAGPETAGLAILPEPPRHFADDLCDRLAPLRQPKDVLVVSLHWGGNWGYGVPDWQRRLAHDLIDKAGAKVVFGHSSHHPKGAELYRGGLILYGAGDLLNDYEGIGGHEDYPIGMALGHFVDIGRDRSDVPVCRMRPYRIRRFRLEHADMTEARRLGDIMIRESAVFGTTARQGADGDITLSAGS